MAALMAERLKAGWPKRIKIFFITASVSDAAADILIFSVYPPVQVICKMRMDSDMPDRSPEFPGDIKDTVSNFFKKIHHHLHRNGLSLLQPEPGTSLRVSAGEKEYHFDR
jgi:hypothetical protein